MSNEEFERKMEFILEQQASFAANHAKQQERNAEVDRQLQQLVASLSILRDAIIGLTHHVERHDQEMAEIRRANAERVERGKEIDARLNALMVVVERHISGHQ